MAKQFAPKPPLITLLRALMPELYEGALHEKQSPEEGIFWWIPIQHGKGKPITWSVLPFFTDDYFHTQGGVLHPGRWPDVVEVLITVWGNVKLRSQIADCYAGLPRGRVNVNNEGGYTIEYGHNNPAGTSIRDVAAKFGIPPGGNNRVEPYDPTFWHYDVDPVQCAKIEKALGVKLDLKTGHKANSAESVYKAMK